MSDNYTYSRPYGEAAFKIALENNAIDFWSNTLTVLSLVIEDKDIKAILADPKISNDKCISLLLGFSQDSSHGELNNFLNMLMDNKRIFYMKEISSIFENLKLSHEKVFIAEVETSHKLTTDQLSKLSSLLKHKYNSDIKVNQKINKSLIAGLRVKINDEVLDLSVQNRLDQIKQQLII